MVNSGRVAKKLRVCGYNTTREEGLPYMRPGLMWTLDTLEH